MADNFIDIVFDGPPSHQAPQFVEVEDSTGCSISFGQWVDRGAFWALRIPDIRWRPIATLRPTKDLIFAATADERVMLWRADFLLRNLAHNPELGGDRPFTPEHLQFPAIAWMPLPATPKEPPK